MAHLRETEPITGTTPHARSLRQIVKRLLSAPSGTLGPTLLVQRNERDAVLLFESEYLIVLLASDPDEDLASTLPERLDAVLEVPLREGPLLLQWDVVQEGVRWLAEVDPSPPPPVVVILRAGYAFEVVAGAAPSWLRAGRQVMRRLSIAITGLELPAVGFLHAAGDGDGHQGVKVLQTEK